MIEQTTLPLEEKTSLRVNVELLDTLMTLAGELVLSRNQLLRGVGTSNNKAIELSSQRIDLITSELQEAIMRTRMQPIGNIFNEITRVVKDLSRQQGKTIHLDLEGREVELDKTIIEAIKDPLIRLVGDAVGHGIEAPEDRERSGKKNEGEIKIKAFHDAGQVNIVISDDGRGFDAKKIADIPGRGAGMDAVTSSVEGLGGVIELDSMPGKGTDIQIKLPLTLAIIPSQITSIGDERYAIPQANLKELLRIPAADMKDRIERVGDADVIRLRGELLPLLNLARMLDIQHSTPDADKNHLDKNKDSNAVNIAVVSDAAFKYGLVVDRLHDSEEIVVKPVGRHLKDCTAYAGATIMGDGKVALILDIANLAQMAELSAAAEAVQAAEESVNLPMEESEKNKTALLTFKNGESEYFAAPLALVDRIERIEPAAMETIGNHKVIQYRGGALPLYELSQIGDFAPLPQRRFQEVIVFRIKGREIGLMVSPPVDTLEVILNLDETTLKHNAVQGSMIIRNHTTLLISILEMAKYLHPDWFAGDAATDQI